MQPKAKPGTLGRARGNARGADAPRHGARGEHAYRRLRDAIQQGELKPGQRVMEIEMADWCA
jgi:DNA-binding GntR family transcriptional regulator